MAGRFVTLEGGEGTGKSTQAGLLVEYLSRECGIDTLASREPGGSPGAEQIRELLVSGDVGRWGPMTEVMLHYAARREHMVETVFPALKAGRWVVCDRFADSTMAYQGYGHGLDREVIKRVHRLVLGGFAPDLTLMFDLPAAEGLKRAAGRAGGTAAAEDRYERMGTAFHERLRQGFLDIAEREPRRCLVIDASQPVEAVHAMVRRAVDERLLESIHEDGGNGQR